MLDHRGVHLHSSGAPHGKLFSSLIFRIVQMFLLNVFFNFSAHILSVYIVYYVDISAYQVMMHVQMAGNQVMNLSLDCRMTRSLQLVVLLIGMLLLCYFLFYHMLQHFCMFFSQFIDCMSCIIFQFLSYFISSVVQLRRLLIVLVISLKFFAKQLVICCILGCCSSSLEIVSIVQVMCSIFQLSFTLHYYA